jgi:serine/threonine protein kinase
MELPTPPQNSAEPQERSIEDEPLEGGISLFLRLWSYGSPTLPPSGLVVEQDAEIAELIQEIVAEGKGKIVQRQPELWSARFDDSPHALLTAKTLQQRFLTFQRKTEPQQVVPSILIYPTNGDKPSGPDGALPEDMLANVTSAQILIAECIYEVMKNASGFHFNSTPLRKAGETFGPEGIYEMLWTDESTYGHLRKASRAGLKTVGRYQIQEELGRGAMGAVYKAYDELIGRTVALKTISINHNAPDREELIERLKQEAKAAGGLDHPNIITIYDVGQEDDVVYLSMQYVKGITLASLLADVGVPSLVTLLSWADQICAAVGFAHARGVIHRDLKPANLMVTEEGVIKVLDFGIAKIENTSLTQTGLVVGTPSYMSPEQLAGKKVDQRSDIFSLGSVFYELVARERPFRGDVTTILYKIVSEDPVAPSLINPAVPGGIDAVIRRALAKEPKERFQTCEELRAAFAEQAARMNVSPAALGSGAIPAVKAKAQPEPALPSFLLTDPPPKPRNWWPIVFMLLFLGTAAWALYIHSTTGSYPAFVNKLTAGAHQLPQTLRDLRSASIGQDKATSPDQNPQSSTENNADASANNAAAQPGAAPNQAPPIVLQTAPDGSDDATPSTGTPDGQPISPSDGTGTAVMTRQGPLQTALPQTGAVPSAAPGGVSNTAASHLDRSPFHPVSNDGQKNPAIAAQTAKKPLHLPAATVDGFSRKNIPELLRVADTAARRGDYRLASYEYNLILKLDHSNTRARIGLRLIQSGERLR